jgi:hypothetical protein
MHYSRGPKGLTISVAPGLLPAVVGLLSGLVAHACG